MPVTNCPSCGAPLTVGPGTIRSCKFCGLQFEDTESGIPDIESIKYLIKIGDREQALKALSEAVEKSPNSIIFWIMKGNLANTVSDRDYSYKVVDRLKDNIDGSKEILDIEWDSMVFNWGCELSIDDKKTIKLGGMQKYRTIVDKGEHTLVFRCNGNKLKTEKKIDTRSKNKVKLSAKSGFFNKELIIE